ncbi:MAG TPA: N-acetylmuramoyl-L-alanine amidase [Bdellovibrionales bacterium]|nr:N-acetylmuramoyl-L-alanine amidase [Bdellovibrionales bacterium]
MKLVTNVRSPNFAPNEIPVEFLVLHYTACDIKRTLEIFKDREKKVCAHFVVDTNGDIYDLGGFFRGPILQGAHAGVSNFTFQGRLLEKFNTFSIGIEIVNLNGNVFAYTDEQYEALAKLINHLQGRFPKLLDPERVVGHEDIAGFRGKADPGYHFDWPRFFREAYGVPSGPRRISVCSEDDIRELKKIVKQATDQERADPLFWSRVSSELEEKIRLRAQARVQ